jgi:hypothetical protein
MAVVGTRTEFEPLPNFTLGVELTYTQLYTAKPSAGTAVPSGGAALPTANVSDQDAWGAIFRIQRNFAQ